MTTEADTTRQHMAEVQEWLASNLPPIDTCLTDGERTRYAKLAADAEQVER